VSGGGSGTSLRWGPTVSVVVRAVALHPTLWPAAAGVARRLAPPGWWRRPPRLPLPDEDYWRFRLTTAYGLGAAGPPTAEDVRAYLHWCRGSRPRRD
jgi:hypothetical protein